MPGFDEQIVLRGAISAYFCERHAKAFGADPHCLRQDLLQIAFAKRKAAKTGDRGLLAQKPADFCASIGHAATAGGAVAAGFNTWKPFGNGGSALPVAMISATISRLRSRSAVL